MSYTNPERKRETAKRWYASNRLRILKSRKGKKYDPRKKHDQHLRRKYGITIAMYDTMFVDQSGRCAICRREAINGRRLHVDHNHKTGLVRGLLCYGCNSSLGHLEKNLDIFLEYLER